MFVAKNVRLGLAQSKYPGTRQPPLTEALVLGTRQSPLTEALVLGTRQPPLTEALVLGTRQQHPLTDALVLGTRQPPLTEALVLGTRQPPLTEALVLGTRQPPLTEALVLGTRQPPLTEALVLGTRQPPLTEALVLGTRQPPLTEALVLGTRRPSLTEALVLGTREPPLTEALVSLLRTRGNERRSCAHTHPKIPAPLSRVGVGRTAQGSTLKTPSLRLEERRPAEELRRHSTTSHRAAYSSVTVLVAVALVWMGSAAEGTWKSGLYRDQSAVVTHAGSVYHKRNWCPHTVTKTVTCQVQNGTVVQRVYQSCRWPQGCSGGSYRSVLRPSYKLVYRTVTSLEWKCCPGFSGAACTQATIVSFAAADPSLCGGGARDWATCG
uniref:EMI domain-containing protein n=1 Tax=Knipowitschia caucasica TaxID=637954 RepID=A0AAV2MTS1_KNICA